jgi:hypothetical protein
MDGRSSLPWRRRGRNPGIRIEPDRSFSTASGTKSEGCTTARAPREHPVPRKAAPRFDGKGGNHRIPHAPRDGEARERHHPEPSPERAPVPLPPRFGNEDSLDRGARKTSTSAAASRRAERRRRSEPFYPR